MKKILAVFVVAALLFCTGCSSTSKEKAPSNYEQLHGLIGKPITEACKELGLDEAEVLAANQRKEDYKLPDAVEFAGIIWDVYLSFDWEQEAVLAFLYVRDYGSDVKQSAEDAAKLAVHLVEHYGERAGLPDNVESLTDKNALHLNQLSAEELYRMIQDADYFSRQEIWDLKDQITDTMRSFHEEAIKDYTGEYVPRNQLYEMNLKYAAKYEEFARITLEYRFRALYY